jgi:hypothetical protein
VDSVRKLGRIVICNEISAVGIFIWELWCNWDIGLNFIFLSLTESRITSSIDIRKTLRLGVRFQPGVHVMWLVVTGLAN